MRATGFCALLLGVAALPAQDIKEFEKHVTEFALPNGLQFLIVERHDAPAVSFHTYVRAGSADDPTGHTGLASLFERLAFTGTEAIGSKNWAEERKALDAVEEAYDRLEAERNLVKPSPGRIDTLEAHVRVAVDNANRYADSKQYSDVLLENGSTGVGVTVSADATESYYSLPSNRLELWFLMESQRLMRPVFRDFYTERAASMEQQQRRSDIAAQGRLFTEFAAAAFEAHPYRNPTGGWPSDLPSLRRTDAKAFFDQYYVPGNITMTIVGDVNPAEARRMAEKYFGGWPARLAPPLVHTLDPPPLGPRTVVVESGNVQTGITLVGYKRPSRFDPDDAALDVLQILLSQGRTGLLYKELITDKHLAQSAQAASSFPGGRFPNIFLFVVVPAQGHTADELQRALDEFLNRLKQQRLDDNTMVRARAQARVTLMNRLGGNAGLAAMLGLYRGGYGDWRKLFLTVGEVNKVSAGDIQRVLLKYFVPIGRTTAYTMYPGQSGMPPAPRPSPPAVDKPGDKK